LQAERQEQLHRGLVDRDGILDRPLNRYGLPAVLDRNVRDILPLGCRVS
jgi:hypothetical protein